MAIEAAVHHHAQAARHAAAAAAGHAEEIPEVPNLITLLAHRLHDNPLVGWLHHWENLVFALLIAGVLSALAWRYGRRPAAIPRGGQNLLELLVSALDGMVQGIIGPAGRAHTPFVGSLFLYIWFMNLAGLVPGLKSPTANINTTAALALTVFCYVQWVGIRSQGPLLYLDHMAGSPRDLIGWLMVPLMLPIHVLGELVKPLSLSLRLCLNVFAEDVLLGVLVVMGLGIAAAIRLPVGVPLQALALPLVLIFSTVQAMVFSLLTSVYIALMLPHGDGEHHEAHH